MERIVFFLGIVGVVLRILWPIILDVVLFFQSFRKDVVEVKREKNGFTIKKRELEL